MCQMMSFDSDSKENSRDLGPWKSWRSCYFWPFDRNKGRLTAKEHQSVKSNFTCSLLFWWHIMWEWELVVIQRSLTKFLCVPLAERLLSLCLRYLGCLCSEVQGQPHSLRHLPIAWEKQASIPISYPQSLQKWLNRQTDRGLASRLRSRLEQERDNWRLCVDVNASKIGCRPGVRAQRQRHRPCEGTARQDHLPALLQGNGHSAPATQTSAGISAARRALPELVGLHPGVSDVHLEEEAFHCQAALESHEMSLITGK